MATGWLYATLDGLGNDAADLLSAELAPHDAGRRHRPHVASRFFEGALVSRASFSPASAEA